MFDSSNSNQTSLVKNGLYLIQRLEHRTNPEGRKGVDKYVIHDYMGSAEFEFGAIPATWKQFRNNSQDLVRTSIQLPGLSFLCISHKSISKEELTYSLQLLLDDKVRVKENTYLPERLARKGTSYRNTVAWLRVGENYAPLLWTVSPELCKKLCEELNVPK